MGQARRPAVVPSEGGRWARWPRSTAAQRAAQAAAQAVAASSSRCSPIAIFFGCSRSGLGTISESTPFSMLAVMLSGSTPLGTRNVRSKAPKVRSACAHVVPSSSCGRLRAPRTVRASFASSMSMSSVVSPGRSKVSTRSPPLTDTSTGGRNAEPRGKGAKGNEANGSLHSIFGGFLLSVSTRLLGGETLPLRVLRRVAGSVNPAKMNHVIEHEDDIGRGQCLDRELASDLGRRRPWRSPGAMLYADALEHRALLAPDAELQLARRAKAGDDSARAQLVEAFMPL